MAAPDFHNGGLLSKNTTLKAQDSPGLKELVIKVYKHISVP